MRENEAAINRWIIEPDFLSGNLRADPAATLFGSKIAAPVIAAPIASHTLFHTAGEAATAKGTDQAGSIFVSSSASTLDLETIAASSPGPKWFQIYLPVDRGFARELLQRAKAAGYKVIVITVDATVISNRERVMRVIGSATPNLGGGNKPRTPGVDPIAAAAWKRDLTWDDVAFCGTELGLPVVVKSIITLKNVKQAMAHGCAGVWIRTMVDASSTMWPRPWMCCHASSRPWMAVAQSLSMAAFAAVRMYSAPWRLERALCRLAAR